ncbi:response regulator receiver protein [Candidatus Scalindua japonica]|uniref:Response regulator receiver protein n=1 Tax=Candidatus Scalindua japonica TaxID=1284222 RepID=A0A286TZU7_9BACT|nr:response regulator [Candidatus Scalindua japonica]GAX61388.1 response regulator receiver protein [Candidatus Scalindua japonica]
MTKAKIMIVEDEWIAAEDTQYKLQDMGYTVSALASTGKEAIQKAEEDKPDLVLTDIVLEGEMDGIEVAKQIYPRFDIPFIYLTAYADDKILERIKVTEPFGYIVKPFTSEDLKIAIELALYKHKAEGKRRKRIQDLSNALAKNRTLAGPLHICSSCKKIQDEEGDWKRIEDFISELSGAEFKHMVCPVCEKIRNT